MAAEDFAYVEIVVQVKQDNCDNPRASTKKD
jgi:hypothetical protein